MGSDLVNEKATAPCLLLSPISLSLYSGTYVKFHTMLEYAGSEINLKVECPTCYKHCTAAQT